MSIPALALPLGMIGPAQLTIIVVLLLIFLVPLLLVLKLMNKKGRR